MTALLRNNSFLIALLCAAAAALTWPSLGAPDGPLHTAQTTRIGVMVIFLLQGLGLPTERLLHGLLNWRLHLFVQVMNFLVAPAVAFLLLAVGGGLLPPHLQMGLLFLSFLPTTVSSAILFTTAADGNAPGAVFNTALSNVLGVFLVPGWTLVAIAAPGAAGVRTGDVLDLLGRLSFLILLPLLVGQSVRPFAGRWLPRVRPWFRPLNNCIILFILFSAMAGSRLQGAWGNLTIVHTAALFCITLALLAALVAIAWYGAGRFLTEPQDRVTAFFCGSQKSLASGIPFAVTVFGTQADLAPHIGVLVLPLVIYHSSQLLLGSMLIPSLRRTVHRGAPSVRH